MKVFVWQQLKTYTYYEYSGGVVVFAESEDRARTIAREAGCHIGDDEKPDEVRKVTSGKERVIIISDN